MIFRNLIVAAAVGSFLSACAPQMATQTMEDSSNRGQEFPSSPDNPPTPGWEKVEFNSIANGGSNNGELVVYIDRANQSLVLVTPIPVLIPIFNPIDIPDLPGAVIFSYRDTVNGQFYLAANVPLEYIIHGAQFSEPQRLPNGDRLPYVPAGELPGFAISFPGQPDYRIHLYVGVNVAALYTELPKFDIPPEICLLGCLWPVTNRAKTRTVGALGLVPNKAQFPGGVYLAAQLPPELARVIDELIRW